MGHPVEVLEDSFTRVRDALLSGEPLPLEMLDLAAEAVSEDESHAEGVSKRIFTEIVEPLCDSFEPELSQRCDSFLTALIGQV